MENNDFSNQYHAAGDNDSAPLDSDQISNIEAVIIVLLFLVVSHLLNYICRGSQKPKYPQGKQKVDIL